MSDLEASVYENVRKCPIWMNFLESDGIEGNLNKNFETKSNKIQ